MVRGALSARTGRTGSGRLVYSPSPPILRGAMESSQPPYLIPGDLGSGEPSLPPPPSPMPPFPPDLPPPDEAPLISSTGVFFGMIMIFVVALFAYGEIQRRRRAWQSRNDAEHLLYETSTSVGSSAGAQRMAAVRDDDEASDAGYGAL